MSKPKNNSTIKTAEAVSPQHPDKICDQISDAVLDAVLAQDPSGRVAVEAMGGHGQLVIMGEVTTSAQFDAAAIARPFLPKGYKISINITRQSPEIAAGVDSGGAGDQGIMVGYATAESADLTPLEYHLARDLNQAIYKRFANDGKTQITLADGQITDVVASFQYAKSNQLVQIIEGWLEDKPHYQPRLHANPAGDWQIGGFESDTGLTGRKLVADNYGPRIPIGGGCFSGKDATKVDRSAAYMARRVAVDFLKKYQAKEVYTYLAYAIGVAKPVHAQALVDSQAQPIEGYDLTPDGIIKALNLRQPQFTATAEYGHFGCGFTWDS